VIGLSAAFGAALNGTMVMPLIVMALNRIPGIGEGAATAIAACELAGIALYSMLAPRLVLRAWRPTTIAGLLALFLGEAATQYLSGTLSLAGARLLAGLGEGALFSLITSAVAGQTAAQRVWGQINLLGGLAMGALLYGLSALPPRSDRGTLFLWLAAMAVLVTPLVLMISPERRITERRAGAARALRQPQLGLILLVVPLVYAVQSGQWAVSGYIGALAHMTPPRVGLFLALSSIAGFAGALIPSLTRNPAHRLAYVTLGFALMAIALLVFFNRLGEWPFLCGQTALNIGFYAVTPFVTGLLTENDRDGALVLRTLVLALIGAAAGTALAGALFDACGPRTFSALCIAVLAAAAVGAALVFRRLSRDDKTLQEMTT
jgi:MFS transporter, DHA1 family, inner membrane transport protein